MISQTSRDFRKAFEKLPADIQKLARKNYRLWRNDPSHPSLQFKKVHTTEPIYSVRVGRDSRALGLKLDNTLLWFWIGHHSVYDKLLARL